MGYCCYHGGMKLPQVFHTADEAERWVTTRFQGSWPQKLSQHHLHALDEYKHVGRRINAVLRHPVPSYFNEYRNVIENIDSAIGLGVLPEPIIVWRGLVSQSLGEKLPYLQDAVLRDPAFLSTSLLLREAQEFTGYCGKENIERFIMRIALPSGMPAAPIELVSNIHIEHELVLGRSLPLIVQAVHQAPNHYDNHIHFLEMTVEH